LLSHYTAEPLRSLLQSLIGQTIVKDKKEQIICSKIFTQVQKLITNRNDLIHSKWYFYGLQKEEEEQKVIAFGVRLHANSSGAAKKNINLEKSKIEEHIKQCKEAGIMISLLMRCVMGMRSLKDCFAIENKQLVIQYDALKPIPI